MKVISAYMLAVVGGNDKPSVADVKKILSSVGAELDGDESKKLEDLVEEMSAKDVAEVVAAGLEKLKTVPMGGGGGGGGGAAPAGGAAAGGDAPAAKKKTTTEEDDMPAAGGLFDDADDY